MKSNSKWTAFLVHVVSSGSEVRAMRAHTIKIKKGVTQTATCSAYWVLVLLTHCQTMLPGQSFSNALHLFNPPLGATPPPLHLLLVIRVPQGAGQNRLKKCVGAAAYKQLEMSPNHSLYWCKCLLLSPVILYVLLIILCVFYLSCRQ